MGKYAILAFFFGFSLSTSAQFSETIRSGRPGQSIDPFAVGKSILQVQAGMDLFGFDNSSSNLDGSGFISNTVIRYGFAKRWEASALVNYAHTEINRVDNKTELDGLAALDVGGRYHIYSGEGLIPNIGLQLRFRLPILSQDYEIDKVAPRFTVVTSQQLSFICYTLRSLMSLILNAGAL